MNKKDTVEKILYYHFEIENICNKENYSLLRAVIYKDTGLQGEEYYNGEWHREKAALSYYPDPTPGEFVDEIRAKEIMKIIDEEVR